MYIRPIDAGRGPGVRRAAGPIRRPNSRITAGGRPFDPFLCRGLSPSSVQAYIAHSRGSTPTPGMPTIWCLLTLPCPRVLHDL